MSGADESGAFLDSTSGESTIYASDVRTVPLNGTGREPEWMMENVAIRAAAGSPLQLCFCEMRLIPDLATGCQLWSRLVRTELAVASDVKLLERNSVTVSEGTQSQAPASYFDNSRLSCSAGSCRFRGSPTHMSSGCVPMLTHLKRLKT